MDCVKTAGGLYYYTRLSFFKQVSVQDRTGFEPLTLGMAQWEPIESLGLEAPPTFVTANVL